MEISLFLIIIMKSVCAYYNICKITDLEEIRVNHVNHPKSRIKGEIRFEFNIIQKIKKSNKSKIQIK